VPGVGKELGKGIPLGGRRRTPAAPKLLVGWWGETVVFPHPCLSVEVPAATTTPRYDATTPAPRRDMGIRRSWAGAMAYGRAGGQHQPLNCHSLVATWSLVMWRKEAHLAGGVTLKQARF